jgi:hypothetical protein
MLLIRWRGGCVYWVEGPRLGCTSRRAALPTAAQHEDELAFRGDQNGGRSRPRNSDWYLPKQARAKRNRIQQDRTGRVTHRATVVLFPDGTGDRKDLNQFAAGCAAFERDNQAESKWFKFTSPIALTRWGYCTEVQAKKYAEIRGRETEAVAVDGRPDDDGATITNIAFALEATDP